MRLYSIEQFSLKGKERKYIVLNEIQCSSTGIWTFLTLSEENQLAVHIFMDTDNPELWQSCFQLKTKDQQLISLF